VEKTLQLPTHPAVFAVGDIIDWKEQKQAAKANGHGPVVVANVVNLLAGRPVQKEYGGFPEAIMITNGKVRKSRPLFRNHLLPMSAIAERRIRIPSLPLGNYSGQLHHSTRQVEEFVNLDGSR
jgi:NADH dehydrogenase FAD-containing subunit